MTEAVTPPPPPPFRGDAGRVLALLGLIGRVASLLARLDRRDGSPSRSSAAGSESWKVVWSEALLGPMGRVAVGLVRIKGKRHAPVRLLGSNRGEGRVRAVVRMEEESRVPAVRIVGESPRASSSGSWESLLAVRVMERVIARHPNCESRSEALP